MATECPAVKFDSGAFSFVALDVLSSFAHAMHAKHNALQIQPLRGQYLLVSMASATDFKTYPQKGVVR